MRKKMKSRQCFITVFICISVLLSSTSLVVADPSIVISSYDLSPEVFMPGDTGTVTLTVCNAETTHTVASTSTSGNSHTVRTDTVGATINKVWILRKLQSSRASNISSSVAPASKALRT